MTQSMTRRQVVKHLSGTVALGICGITPARADWHKNAPAFEGEQRDFSPRLTITETPRFPFLNDAGEEITVDAFHGKVVVLNFWATWCPPCVTEMPSLNALQGRFDGEGFEVVALSLDPPPDVTGGTDVAAAFLKKHGLDQLGLYRAMDPQKTFEAFRLGALPTTLVLDRAGDTVGVLAGPADWDSPAAYSLVRYYLEHAPAF